jgi:hypothetical protein
VPLHPIRFSLVDVPDLRVLPKAWPGLQSVWMGAGPVPEIWHRALNVLARFVSLRALPSASGFAPLMHRAIRILRWGEHRGGMFVAIEGPSKDGGPVKRSWHLLAEGEDGPFIPSMAVEGIVRRCLDGRDPAAGARAATGDLEVADYEALFAHRTITTGTWNDGAEKADTPLYRRVLGSACDEMPESWRALHNVHSRLVVEGVAQIDRGGGLLARLVAAVMRFPPAGKDAPLTVTFDVENGRERWTRNFAGRSFFSTQEQGRGRYERLLVERFGPLAFAMALVVEDRRMRLVLRRWSCFGIPMPLALAPRSDAYEFEENGRFNFHVAISHPLTGLIVRYRGWLVPRP